MIRVGLVGEDPNDTSSVKNFLLKKYARKVQFYPLANRIKGHQLDNHKIKKSLIIEFHEKKCKFVLYIRDLDGFKSENDKIKKRKQWFEELDSTINKEGILMLNIWELEGLILADIETFNSIYKTRYKYTGDPMAQKEPKEELKRITSKGQRKYKESDCPEIFEKLNFEIVEKRCSCFKDFIEEFDERINPSKHRAAKKKRTS